LAHFHFPNGCLVRDYFRRLRAFDAEYRSSIGAAGHLYTAFHRPPDGGIDRPSIRHSGANSPEYRHADNRRTGHRSARLGAGGRAGAAGQGENQSDRCLAG
jgi:hypothetical protein